MADLTFAEMKEQAYELLVLYTEPCCAPSIEGLELSILSRHIRAKVWAENTVYVAGDVVQPYPRNGYRYECIYGGTSGYTVSIFKTGEFVEGTVTWRAIGPDYENVFDIRAAAHEAWTIKTSRATHLVTTSSGSASVQASLLHEQCRARAMEFTPLD